MKKRGITLKKKWMELLLLAALIGGVMAAAAWFTEGFLRFALLVVPYFALTEILADMVRLALGEPEPKKRTQEEQVRAENQWYEERQDPAWVPRLRPVGYVLWGVSFLLTITGIVPVGPYELHAIACLICFGVCVILCAVFPAYFSFAYIEGEKGGGYTFHIVNLMIPIIMSLAAGSLRVLTEFTVVSWMAVLKAVLVTAAVCGAVLRMAVPELRRITSNWVGLTFFVLFFGLGLAAPLNHLLASAPPEIVTATVTEYHPGGHRNPPDYSVLLENGQEINMTANDGMSRCNFRIGQEIELEYHHGALGIDYYAYTD